MERTTPERMWREESERDSLDHIIKVVIQQFPFYNGCNRCNSSNVFHWTSNNTSMCLWSLYVLMYLTQLLLPTHETQNLKYRNSSPQHRHKLHTIQLHLDSGATPLNESRCSLDFSPDLTVNIVHMCFFRPLSHTTRIFPIPFLA
jgi:hypothetical protein